MEWNGEERILLLTNRLTESKQKIIAKLQSENKQLNLQILAIKNERNRIRAQYENDMENLWILQEHFDQIKNGIKHLPNDLAN